MVSVEGFEPSPTEGNRVLETPALPLGYTELNDKTLIKIATFDYQSNAFLNNDCWKCLSFFYKYYNIFYFKSQIFDF